MQRNWGTCDLGQDQRTTNLANPLEQSLQETIERGSSQWQVLDLFSDTVSCDLDILGKQHGLPHLAPWGVVKWNCDIQPALCVSHVATGLWVLSPIASGSVNTNVIFASTVCDTYWAIQIKLVSIPVSTIAPLKEILGFLLSSCFVFFLSYSAFFITMWCGLTFHSKIKSSQL